MATLCKTLVAHHDELFRFDWAHQAATILRELGLPVPENNGCKCFEDEKGDFGG